MPADPPLPDLTGFMLLPLPPMSKTSTKTKKLGLTKAGKAMMFNTTEYKQWKEALGWHWVALRKKLGLPVPGKDEIRLKLRYCFIVPDLIRRDVSDNAISGTIDSMCGVLIRDDTDFWDSHGTKHLDRDLKECQLWLKVSRL